MSKMLVIEECNHCCWSTSKYCKPGEIKCQKTGDRQPGEGIPSRCPLPDAPGEDGGRWYRAHRPPLKPGMTGSPRLLIHAQDAGAARVKAAVAWNCPLQEIGPLEPMGSLLPDVVEC